MEMKAGTVLSLFGNAGAEVDRGFRRAECLKELLQSSFYLRGWENVFITTAVFPAGYVPPSQGFVLLL